MDKKGIVIASLLLVCLQPKLGNAEGAIAVGLPGNVAKDGVSLGMRKDSKTMEDARAGALENCRTAKEAGEVARKLCKIVATFRNQCYAFAIDPAAGTSGFGWAIANDEPSAKQRALDNCRATSRPARRGACVGTDSGCDKSDN